jgi:hypothetical protein
MAKIGKPNKVFGKGKTPSENITVNVSPPKPGSKSALQKSGEYFIPGPMFGGTPTTQRSPFKESGYPGLRMYHGYVSEDFIQDLRGKRGIEVYEQMRKNDAVVGSMLRASYQLIHNAGIFVDPSAKNPDDPQSQLAADIVRTSLFDMKNTWADILSEILTMLPFGWAYCAVWLKKREGYKRDPYKSSRQDDGKYGWSNMSIRAHNSLESWETDPNGRLSGMVQSGPPTWKPIRIPLDNAAHFRTDTYKENPEGESVLRNAWLAWKMKTELEEVEAIGLSRELTGLPTLTVPEGIDIWNSNDSNASTALTAAKDIVQLAKADKYGGFVLPFGWELKVLTTPGQRAHNSDTVISRWDQRIAVTMLADMLLIGHERVGSYALVNQKSRLFSSALESYAARISGVFNKDLIPRLMSINGIPQEYWPTIRFGQVDTPDLKELAEMVNAIGNTDIKIDEAFGLALRQHMSIPPPRVGDNAVKTHEEKLEEQEVEFEQGIDHQRRQQEMFAEFEPEQEGAEGGGKPPVQMGSQPKAPDEKERPKNKPAPPPGKDTTKKVLVVKDSPMTRYALGLLGDTDD